MADVKTSVVKQEQKLKELAQDSSFVLYEITAVFPFQIFPDELIIDKNKVTIVRRALFYERMVPIAYKDILSVKINRGLIFAAIEFEIKGYETNPSPVVHLWPEEALKAEKYIMGLSQAVKNGVDLTPLTREQILGRLEEIL